MVRATMSDSRRILRRLTGIMAEGGRAEGRLDQVVKIIAAELRAEVCSVYVMRAGQVLELFATEGLKREAVHKTRLRVGEGLIGLTAARASPVNLDNAQAHPMFAFRPETGEEIYHSLLGVPVIRGGRVRGVLVVQNRSRRTYPDEVVETLEVIAMVLAELIGSGELVSPEERVSIQGNAILTMRLDGVKVHGGLAIGEAVLHQPRVSIPYLVAEDPQAELDRLADALSGMHHAIDELLGDTPLPMRGEHREVLDTYRLTAHDRGWLRRMHEAIAGGLTAEAAVQKVEDDMRARLGEVADPYIAERLSDIEDLSGRLMAHLSDAPLTAARSELPESAVLLAHTLGPAELLDYAPERLRALVLEEGSPNSHVAVVARALDIPVVCKVPNLLSRIDANDPVVVDGDNGLVYVRPGDDIREAVTESLALRARRRAGYAALRDRPAVTRDGTPIGLHLNAGLLIDLPHLHDWGADGIGLYRTEIPFMTSSEFPSLADQTELYRAVLKQAAGKPVMFRTLDIGGDKRLPYVRSFGDENPAMGWRAIRVALDRPGILRRQVRALLRAAGGGALNVMFPLIAEVAEFDAAAAVLNLECARERDAGTVMPTVVRVGCMLEVPGLLWQLPALLARVDFVSVGSNDLFQFLFAADRGNPRLADRYDELSPSLLSLLRWVVRQCDAAGVPVSLCGEMAGKPLEAMALIGLGFRTISMPPATLGPIKAMTCSLDIPSLAAYLDRLCAVPAHSVRERLRNYAFDHGTVIDAV